MRGTTLPLQLAIGSRARRFAAREYNPRTGAFRPLGEAEIVHEYKYQAPAKPVSFSPITIQDLVNAAEAKQWLK